MKFNFCFVLIAAIRTKLPVAISLNIPGDVPEMNGFAMQKIVEELTKLDMVRCLAALLYNSTS